MNILLDTHILLWWMADSADLSRQARTIVSDSQNTIFYSAATVWEIRIKESLKKLSIPKSFFQTLFNEPFEKLAISPEHAFAVGTLADIHRDPFDRMLLAQALDEGFTLVSHDRLFEKYKKVKTIIV